MIGAKEAREVTSHAAILSQYMARFCRDTSQFGLAFEGEKRMPDGLCFVEENEGKFQVLRRMLIEGEQSGRADYSYENFLAEFDSSAGIRHQEVS